MFHHGSKMWSRYKMLYHGSVKWYQGGKSQQQQQQQQQVYSVLPFCTGVTD